MNFNFFSLASSTFALLVFSTLAQAEPVKAVNDGSPAWSPNGENIVFTSDRSGTTQIYTMNKNGSEVQQITRGTNTNVTPSWSPDGTKIAFCTDRDGNDEIYVIDPDGKNPENLTNNPAPDCGTPSWSPDGTKLTFSSNRDGNWQVEPEDNYNIYVMNADGSDQQVVVQLKGYDLSTDQAWTPDGNSIIFCSSGDEPFVSPEGAHWSTLYTGFDIYRIDLDGANLKRLTFTFGEDSYPNISPDGTEIYFARYLSNTGTNYDIYRMTSDGKTITQITDDIHNEGPTSWSPDGKQIVYAQYVGNVQSIWVANADGSNRVKLTNTEIK